MEEKFWELYYGEDFSNWLNNNQKEHLIERYYQSRDYLEGELSFLRRDFKAKRVQSKIDGDITSLEESKIKISKQLDEAINYVCLYAFYEQNTSYFNNIKSNPIVGDLFVPDGPIQRQELVDTVLLLRRTLIDCAAFLCSIQFYIKNPSPDVMPLDKNGRSGSQEEEFEITLSDKTYEIIKEQKGHCKDEIQQILDGISAALLTPQNAYKTHELALFRMTIPCIIFLSLNLARNECPRDKKEEYDSEEFKKRHYKILKCICTAFSNEVKRILDVSNITDLGIDFGMPDDEDNHEGGQALPLIEENYLEDIKNKFLIYEKKNSKIKVLAIRDPGTRVRENFVKNKSTKKDSWQFYFSSESEDGPDEKQFLDDDFDELYSGVEENLSLGIPSLRLFASILKSCEIRIKGAKKSFPINQTINIKVFNRITDFVDIAIKHVLFASPFSHMLNEKFLLLGQISPETCKNLKRIIRLSYILFHNSHLREPVDPQENFLFDLLEFRPLRTDGAVPGKYDWRVRTDI